MSRSLFRAPAALTAVAVLALAALVGPAAPAQATTTFTPRVVVAMGDSITRAASADGTRGDNSANSWSTGRSSTVNSHLLRIAADIGWTPPGYNVAVGGTTSEDLARQATSAVGRDADYITILSGGNDVCRSESVDALPSPASVAANFASALSIINDGRPEARIFVASIPNMRKLHAAGLLTADAAAVWTYADICPIALGDPLNTSAAAEQRRAAVERHIVSLNAAIAEACASASLCFYDDGAVFDRDIAPGYLSTLDYFHPSVQGQTALAALTWAKVQEKGVFAATPPLDDFVIDETSSAITWTGEWASTRSSQDRGGSVNYLKSMKSGLSLEFTGVQVSLVARTTPSAGISEISIDGRVVAHVNSYSSKSRYNQVVFTSDRLSFGTHTVTVTPTIDLPAGSSGRNLVIDAFLVEGVAP